MSDLLAAALNYASHGWPVFPLSPRSKVPQIKGGFTAATLDPDKIKAWWSESPMSNIGVPTGTDTFMVLDIDPDKGGEISLIEITAQRGKLPDTVLSMTGGGGWHYLFKCPAGARNNVGYLGAGIDIRANGGYIVVPPSIHPCGRPYLWEASSQPFETALAEPPAWLLRPTVGGPAGNLAGFVAGLDPNDEGPIGVGQRNAKLAQLVGKWISLGAGPIASLKQAKEWSASLEHPLDEREVQRTWDSVWTTHSRNHSIPMPEPVAELEGPPAPKAKANPWPPHLLTPPGFLGELVAFSNSTSIKLQPMLSVGAMLCFWGAILGHKVATSTGLRTNFYGLGVGETSSGKEASRKAIKRLIDDCELGQLIFAGEQVSSDAAIMTSLDIHNPGIFVVDEIGHLIASSTHRNALDSARSIPVQFTKLFSCADSTCYGKEYANQKERGRVVIHQPHCCLWGVTVPGVLSKGLSPDEISDGFLPRMLSFHVDEGDQDARWRAEEPTPSGIIETLKHWWHLPLLRKGLGNLVNTQNSRPYVIPFTAAGERLMVDWGKECRAKVRNYRAAGEMISSELWTRGAEHALKVSLAVTAGMGRHIPDLAIGEAEARYAIELIDYILTRQAAWAGSSIAENETERTVQRVQGILAEAGASGMTLTELTRRTRWLSARGRLDVLAQLAGSGVAVQVASTATEGQRGRPSTLWRIV